MDTAPVPDGNSFFAAAPGAPASTDNADAPSPSGGSHRAPRGVRPSRAERRSRRRSASRSRSGRHRRLLPNRPFWQELPILIVIALVAAYLVKTFVFQVFFIPSGSMENTLRINDRVLVDKVSYQFRDLRRGEIVVFNADGVLAPENAPVQPAPNFLVAAIRGIQGTFGLGQNSETDYIKRVIGVGGDRVQCCDAQNRLTVNGVALEESAYLFPGDAPSLTRFDVVVPAGKMWVMGDHRSASADSRSRIGAPGGGFVPTDRVIGRAFAVSWPWRSVRRLSIPETFKQGSLVSTPQASSGS